LLLPGEYPSFFISDLAFGAMTVTATVVTDAQMTTIIASIHMAAQRSGAAFFQSIQYG